MDEIDALGKQLWEYNQMHHQISKSDAVIALGSMDKRVAERAGDIWKNNLAPIVVVAGRYGRLTGNDRTITEAAKFKEVLIRKGVPSEFIIQEDKSTNTAENLIFTINGLKKSNPNLSKVIVVTKPYAEKRTYATFKKLFPVIEVIMASPDVSYHNYPQGEITKDLMINIMVGDTQRIKEYPDKGFTIEQKLPPEIHAAMDKLINLGYNSQLVK